MEKGKVIHSDKVKAFVCDETYSSKYLTGKDVAGFDLINVNEGTLKAGEKTGGGVHEKPEIYYILRGRGDVWLDDVRIPVKAGDCIIIPPGVFHYIDNTGSSEEFVLLTFWEKQEYNELYFIRKKAWGKVYLTIDE